MKYYIGSMQCDPNYLEHHGVKGMHWGERKYQNPDGTLTVEGRQHYGVGERQETRGRDIYEKQQIRRMNRAYNKVSRLDRRIVGEGTARQNRKLEKARERYAEAQGNLDRYHNASDVEKRKARNSIRLRRAAAIGSAAVAAVGSYFLVKHINQIKDSKLAELGRDHAENQRKAWSDFENASREYEGWANGTYFDKDDPSRNRMWEARRDMNEAWQRGHGGKGATLIDTENASKALDRSRKWENGTYFDKDASSRNPHYGQTQAIYERDRAQRLWNNGEHDADYLRATSRVNRRATGAKVAGVVGLGSAGLAGVYAANRRKNNQTKNRRR